MTDPFAGTTTVELRHRLYADFHIRVHPAASRSHIVDLLLLRKARTRNSPVNKQRDVLIQYITTYRKQLSLGCHGRCYEHTDATVLCCYYDLINLEGADAA